MISLAGLLLMTQCKIEQFLWLQKYRIRKFIQKECVNSLLYKYTIIATIGCILKVSLKKALAIFREQEKGMSYYYLTKPYNKLLMFNKPEKYISLRKDSKISFDNSVLPVYFSSHFYGGLEGLLWWLKNNNKKVAILYNQSFVDFVFYLLGENARKKFSSSNLVDIIKYFVPWMKNSSYYSSILFINVDIPTCLFSIKKVLEEEIPVFLFFDVFDIRNGNRMYCSDKKNVFLYFDNKVAAKLSRALFVVLRSVMNKIKKSIAIVPLVSIRKNLFFQEVKIFDPLYINELTDEEIISALYHGAFLPMIHQYPYLFHVSSWWMFRYYSVSDFTPRECNDVDILKKYMLDYEIVWFRNGENFYLITFPCFFALKCDQLTISILKSIKKKGYVSKSVIRKYPYEKIKKRLKFLYMYRIISYMERVEKNI